MHASRDAVAGQLLKVLCHTSVCWNLFATSASNSRRLHACQDTCIPGAAQCACDFASQGYCHSSCCTCVLQFMLMGAQTGLVVWRKQHKRSYDLVSHRSTWHRPDL